MNDEQLYSLLDELVSLPEETDRSTAKPMWVLTKNNTGLDKD